MKKGVLVGILALSLVFSLSLTSAFWPFDIFNGKVTGNVISDNTAVSDDPRCTDSDGGVFSGKAGTVTIKRFWGSSNFVDSCGEESKGKESVLTEYYCDAGRLRYIVNDCERGCDEGACLKSVENESTSINESLSVFDKELYSSLSADTREKALQELHELEEKYSSAWEQISENQEYGSDKGSTLAEWHSLLKNRWEKQKESYLAELALRQKYDLFYPDTDYDSYISELKASWDEQEKEQPWSDSSLGSLTRITGYATNEEPPKRNVVDCASYDKGEGDRREMLRSPYHPIGPKNIKAVNEFWGLVSYAEFREYKTLKIYPLGSENPPQCIEFKTEYSRNDNEIKEFVSFDNELIVVRNKKDIVHNWDACVMNSNIAGDNNKPEGVKGSYVGLVEDYALKSIYVHTYDINDLPTLSDYPNPDSFKLRYLVDHTFIEDRENEGFSNKCRPLPKPQTKSSIRTKIIIGTPGKYEGICDNMIYDTVVAFINGKRITEILKDRSCKLL